MWGSVNHQLAVMFPQLNKSCTIQSAYSGGWSERTVSLQSLWKQKGDLDYFSLVKLPVCVPGVRPPHTLLVSVLRTFADYSATAEGKTTLAWWRQCRLPRCHRSRFPKVRVSSLGTCFVSVSVWCVFVFNQRAVTVIYVLVKRFKHLKYVTHETAYRISFYMAGWTEGYFARECWSQLHSLFLFYDSTFCLQFIKHFKKKEAKNVILVVYLTILTH